MSEWTHRICESCYSLHYGIRDGFLREPVQVKDAEPEPCCRCGGMCLVSGIYVREDEQALMCKGNHETMEWSGWGTKERKDDTAAAAETDS